jgi:cytochrome c-type biogenesis protein CcsB
MSDYLVLLLCGALVSYVGAGIAYVACLRWSWRWLRLASTLLFSLGFVLVTCLIVQSWAASGRPPFKTLYESLLLLTFCTSLVHLGVERVARLPVLGAGASVLLAAALSYAMARRDLETIHLPPALQSPWFIPHVVVYFTGYAVLLMAAVAAGAYLARPGGQVTVESGEGVRAVGYKSIMHVLVIVGFILLTAGLVLGAVWAKEAWGNYWTWDPKENWALISWLSYTLYFHARRLPGCGDRLSAWMAIGAFAVVIFTYLGMHLLPTAESSMHVYQ